MTKSSTSLSRTCVECGLEKPLAAFLQISGTLGTIYGHVCSTCRSTSAHGKTVLPKPKDDDERSGGTGLKIDQKTRIQQEIERKVQDKKIKEKTKEAKEKKEKLVLTKIEHIEQIEKAEKDHRKDYIEGKKKQGFLIQKSTPPPPQKKTDSKIQVQEKLFTHTKQEEAYVQKKKEASAHEAELTPDINLPYVDFHLDKFKTARFNEFKTWLGTANFSPLERLNRQKLSKKEGGTSGPDTPDTSDPYTDYVEQSSKKESPKGGRR